MGYVGRKGARRGTWLFVWCLLLVWSFKGGRVRIMVWSSRKVDVDGLFGMY